MVAKEKRSQQQHTIDEKYAWRKSFVLILYVWLANHNLSGLLSLVGLFLLVQVIILLDFTPSWNDAWLAKDEQKCSDGSLDLFKYVALLVILVGCYIVTYTLSGILFIWFNPSCEDCGLNFFFLVMTMVLGFVNGIVALHSAFPYHEYVDRASMYKMGSLFYAIYFIVSFPMFLRIDEKRGSPWDMPREAVDALGAAMLVTIILDLWHIFLGSIVPVPNSK